MTYTLDNGNPSSYDHEATQSPLLPGLGEPVTLTCECGAWSQTGPATDDGEPDDALVAAWTDHVYATTGQARPAPAHPEPLAPVELVQLIVSGARTLTSRIHRLDDAAVAVQVSAILDEVVAACQQLQGRALAIADSDAEVEAAAVFDAVMARLDGEGGDQR